jgi:DNA-binding transcriptional MerR regulator
MDKKSEKPFSISQVSESTGVSKNRIREWDDKGYLPDVQRISVGSRHHRRFSEKDIELIMKIKGYLDKGFILKVSAEKGKEMMMKKN